MPCYVIHLESGTRAIVRGELGPYCADHRCMDVGTYLCDYPVGDGKTCDMPLCNGHAFEAAPEIHYCPGHALQWRDFQDNGGVRRALEGRSLDKGSKGCSA